MSLQPGLTFTLPRGPWHARLAQRLRRAFARPDRRPVVRWRLAYVRGQWMLRTDGATPTAVDVPSGYATSRIAADAQDAALAWAYAVLPPGVRHVIQADRPD